MPDDKVADDLQKLKADLRALADEVRVKLHLGAMDARQAFAAIEKDLERAGKEVTRTSKKLLERTRDRLQKLAEELKVPPTDHPHP